MWIVSENAQLRLYAVWYNRLTLRLLGLIRRQDTVCQQTQTTEVGETRPLGETR